MLQFNNYNNKLLPVNDYKIYIFLTVSLFGILFLLTLTEQKALAVISTTKLIEEENKHFLFRHIGNDGPWTLKVYVTDPPFGTDKVKVSIKGPYGYTKIKWFSVEGETTVANMKIPGGKIPLGTDYKLCVQTGLIEQLLSNNCYFVQKSNSGNEELSFSLGN